MKTTSSHEAKLYLHKPEGAAHFWVNGDYGEGVTITAISHESAEDAKAQIRAFAHALLKAVETPEDAAPPPDLSDSLE